MLLALADHKDWTRVRVLRAPSALLEPPVIRSWDLVGAWPWLRRCPPSPPTRPARGIAPSVEDAPGSLRPGRILYWTRFSRQLTTTPTPHQRTRAGSPGHADAAVHRRTGRDRTEELETALHWLLCQPRWDNLYEEIRRPIGPGGRGAAQSHYTSSWVVRALLYLVIDPMPGGSDRGGRAVPQATTRAWGLDLARREPVRRPGLG